MMDIQSPSYFRPSTSIPRSSPNNVSTFVSPLSNNNNNRTDISPSKYVNFSRSNGSSYPSPGNMVVESQTLNFGPMTPDPHPDNVNKMDTTEIQTDHNKQQQKVSLPPEGAVTPSDEPLSKKPRLQLSNSEFSPSKDFLSLPPNTTYPTSPIEERNGSMKMNGVPHPEMKETNGSDNMDSEGMNVQLSCNKRPRNADSLLEAAFKIGLDKSPPTLSPKTMSDTDLDGASTGSPSVSISGERRRRKPNLEDIVRRMKEVDTDYYSEDDSECDEEALLERQRMAEAELDEVDGDLDARMTMMPRQMLNQVLKKQYEENDFGIDDHAINHNKGPENSINENNNVIDKMSKDDELDKENIANGDSNKTKNGEVDEKGVPLPASTKAEMLSPNGEHTFHSKNITPHKMENSGWIHGAFNGFPMFPFQASPPDLPYGKFMSPFDNKFSSPEMEKDYLKCQYCERTFRRQKNLENHVENTHHGKSPVRKKPGDSGEMYFKCTHCPYTTKHQSNLYVHLRIHTGERPYICGACGVQYSQSHSLKSHIINKHDGIMSYYIKEKRTRSPRGLGYLTTHAMPGETPVFKLPPSPMMPHSLPHMPGTPNGLHLQSMQNSPSQQQQQQQNLSQHSPHSNAIGSMQQLQSVQHSPVMSPNVPRPQQPQVSPGGHQGPQMSPQMMHHRPPFHPMGPMFHDDMTQKSLELAKLGLMSFPFYPGKPFHCKPSPPFPMNGHSPMSPQYNGLNLQMRQHQQPDMASPTNGGQQQQQQQQQQLQQFHKTHNPLHEIHDNKIQDANGAIDLSKKGKDEALDLAISGEKGVKCSENGPNCPNCLHLLKLKMLRMNVVRMLSILVPNLNFEEKGINAEGDSVDDLLRDVIESNIHDEESND